MRENFFKYINYSTTNKPLKLLSKNGTYIILAPNNNDQRCFQKSVKHKKLHLRYLTGF